VTGPRTARWGCAAPSPVASGRRRRSGSAGRGWRPAATTVPLETLTGAVSPSLERATPRLIVRGRSGAATASHSCSRSAWSRVSPHTTRASPRPPAASSERTARCDRDSSGRSGRALTRW
jgi:hypothetical protein